MRSPNFGIIPDVSRSMPKEILLNVFSRMCFSRHFELKICESFNDGFITYPMYLSLGQESIAATLSLVIPEFMLFTQHRCHATYLSFGGNPLKLRDELLGLPSGTSGGRAGSNCIQCHENKLTMFGHHGLIGENVPQAVGAAYASQQPTACFFGDGAAEEDYVFVAMGFAVTHHLPVLFICENNNLSILTPINVRRSWKMSHVAAALGMASVDIADDPWTIYVKSSELKSKLPAFLSIYTCRSHWHVGVNTDGPPEWNRYEIVRCELIELGLGKQIEEIENKACLKTEELWDKELLQKLLKK